MLRQGVTGQNAQVNVDGRCCARRLGVLQVISV